MYRDELQTEVRSLAERMGAIESGAHVPADPMVIRWRARMCAMVARVRLTAVGAAALSLTLLVGGLVIAVGLDSRVGVVEVVVGVVCVDTQRERNDVLRRLNEIDARIDVHASSAGAAAARADRHDTWHRGFERGRGN